MKRIALAPLILALLTFAPAAQADHGHNCVYSGGAWVGQGLCPGMPGYDDPHGEPTSTPEPTVTSEPTPEPTVTTPTTPAPTTTTPAPSPTNKPTMRPTSTSSPTTSTPAPTRTPGCLTSYGNVWCTGATPSTSTTTPAPVVTGPVVDTDIPYEHRNHPRGW